MEPIYHNEQYRFYLIFRKAGELTGMVRDAAKAGATDGNKESTFGQPGASAGSHAAHMQIIREDAAGKTIVLMDYHFPVQLMPEVHVGEAGTVEKDALHFTLQLEVHHVTGMVQGEFTEEEQYEIRNPFGEEICCVVTDITRKTRFAAASRHLEHLPRQTYPPIDGKQGPYGHPSIRKLPPIPKRKHVETDQV